MNDGLVAIFFGVSQPGNRSCSNRLFFHLKNQSIRNKGITMEGQLEVILVGVIATIVLDAWLLILKHVFHGPTTDWAMVGRWFGHMPRGVFVHQAIGNSAPVRHELAIGWTAHYLIGVAYSYLYLHALVYFEIPISLQSAIAFGLVTVVAAWFILQPGLGAGVFASRLPKPWQARALNLCAHYFFGCGLYLGWWLFGHD